jgi:hypothetical protein
VAVTYRTLRIATYEEYPVARDGAELCDEASSGNQPASLAKFPYFVMLELSFPELDFANRWCWQNFGPPDRLCLDASSEYRSCLIEGDHHHSGSWAWEWYEKTDYDFGYCEWSFANQSDHAAFMEQLPHIHWGEKYPK